MLKDASWHVSPALLLFLLRLQAYELLLQVAIFLQQRCQLLFCLFALGLDALDVQFELLF